MTPAEQHPQRCETCRWQHEELLSPDIIFRRKCDWYEFCMWEEWHPEMKA